MFTIYSPITNRRTVRTSIMKRFIILMYHMVCKPTTHKEARYACPPERLEQHLQYIKSSHYSVVSLNEIEQHLLLGKILPDNSVAITFDDGFEDNYTQAFSLLQKYNIPATIFLASGVIGGSNKWMAGKDYPERKMLNWEQIKEMRDYNISFGAHTVSHPKLPELDTLSASDEIIQSKNQIENQLGTPCLHFAYPYGLFREETPDIVKNAELTLACSTRSGFNNRETNPFLLNRLEVYGTDSVRALKQKMAFGTNDASFLVPLSYYSKRFLKKVSL